MVVCYDVNLFSRVIIKFLLRIESVSLVNVILNRKLVPEFLGKRCKPKLIGEALVELIHNKNLSSKQREGFVELIKILGKSGNSTSNRAANSIRKVLKNSI